MEGEKTFESRSRTRKAAARFHGNAALPAEWAIFRLVIGDGHLQERLCFHFEVDRPSAAVDQRPRSHHAAASLFHNVDGFHRRAARGPHILDHEDVWTT